MSFGSFDSFDPLCFYVFDIFDSWCLFICHLIHLTHPKSQGTVSRSGQRTTTQHGSLRKSGRQLKLVIIFIMVIFSFFKFLKKIEKIKRFNGLHVFYFLFFPGGSVGLWDITPFISSWISWYLAKNSIVYIVSIFFNFLEIWNFENFKYCMIYMIL